MSLMFTYDGQGGPRFQPGEELPDVLMTRIDAGLPL